jgi:hypothetical protein
VRSIIVSPVAELYAERNGVRIRRAGSHQRTRYAAARGKGTGNGAQAIQNRPSTPTLHGGGGSSMSKVPWDCPIRPTDALKPGLPPSPRVLMLVLMLVFAAALGGCAKTLDQNGGEPAAGTSTATSAATATGVSQATSCAAALPGAGPASTGPSFADLPLPPNSVSTAPAQMGGGGAGQFTLDQVQLCTADSSPSAVNAFFSGLTSHSWLHSNTFPADGAYQSTCTNAACWAKDVRYVMLPQPITDLGGGVERYHLIVAVAPPAPDCSGSGNTFSQGYYYAIPDPRYVATNVFAHIPLPPLSRIVPDDASGGQRGYEICSAGTVASISSFMTKHLTDQGWTSTGGGTWTKSGYTLTLILNASAAWVVTWRDPDFHA